MLTARSRCVTILNSAPATWNDNPCANEPLLAIDVEGRQQEVECWRDVIMVMRDFLEIWGSHQQIDTMFAARSGSIFHHAVASCGVTNSR